MILSSSFRTFSGTSCRFRGLSGLGLFLTLSAAMTFGLGQKRYVETTPSAGSFPLAQGCRVTPIYVEVDDYPGVNRAAGDLRSDFQRVTGCRPELTHAANALGPMAILIGTLGKSRIIDRLARERKINTREVSGQWEASVIQVVPHPIPGVERALVIAGSDKRGTIYGIYDLSEQIGVSPWYWWADVPVAHKDALYVKVGTYVMSQPAVKYRGIFLNDEAPSLAGWATEKFGGFNHLFYEKVFELLLRLKANYLWPAMGAAPSTKTILSIPGSPTNTAS